MVGARRLRIVFFGTPEFAVPTLEALFASRHQVVGVVTQPDRPRGRGQRTSEPPVKASAIAAHVPVLQPERLKEPGFMDGLKAFNADIGVVAAYGKILTDDVLATPADGLINVHASLLPKYRGAAPVHRAIIAGERETGVTIMRVVKALDAGPMLARVRRQIGANETSEEIERALAAMGAKLLVATLDALVDGFVVEEPQNDDAATYAPRLTKEDGVVDWTQPAATIHNLIRGLHPWPLAFSFLAGRRIILRRSAPNPDIESPGPGLIAAADGDRLVVGTGAGVVALIEVQLEGKRAVTAREFLAGHHVRPGDRFTASA